MKIHFVQSAQDIRYTAIDDSDRTEKTGPRHVSYFWKAVSAVTVGLMIATAAGLLGFYIGKHSNQDLREDWLGNTLLSALPIVHRLTHCHTAPAGTVNHTFHYRKKFAQRPTHETEKTWQVMFPSTHDLPFPSRKPQTNPPSPLF